MVRNAGPKTGRPSKGCNGSNCTPKFLRITYKLHIQIWELLLYHWQIYKNFNPSMRSPCRNAFSLFSFQNFNSVQNWFQSSKRPQLIFLSSFSILQSLWKKSWFYFFIGQKFFCFDSYTSNFGKYTVKKIIKTLSEKCSSTKHVYLFEMKKLFFNDKK